MTDQEITKYLYSADDLFTRLYYNSEGLLVYEIFNDDTGDLLGNIIVLYNQHPVYGLLLYVIQNQGLCHLVNTIEEALDILRGGK